MTPLEELLVRRIAAGGPMTVADFMSVALTHPAHGYYVSRDPFGAPKTRGGDFVTAPEISQMFGELLGLWAAETWRSLGSPSRFLLVELGPGRGTLMADALRAARLVPDFLRAAELHLVEVSPKLRALQAERLKDHGPSWHGSLADLPTGPLILIANEFFDALPVRQLERCPDGWRERLVGLDPATGALTWTLSPASSLFASLLPPELREAPLDSLYEFSPASRAVSREVAGRLAHHGGAALLIDYGYGKPPLRPTLQALRAHKRAEVLEAPGEADLTAHVDFAALAGAARESGAEVRGPVGQGAFLKALGIEARAAQLLEGATPAQAETIGAGLARLTEEDQMGSLFKVLGLAGPGGLPLAGFLSD